MDILPGRNNIVKFIAYPYKLLLVKGIICLVVAIIIVKLCSFKLIVRLLLKLKPSKLSKKYNLIQVREVYEVLRYKFPIMKQCLVSSTVLYLLSAPYSKVKLKIGVREKDNKVDAHAWIENDGKIITEEKEGFALIYST